MMTTTEIWLTIFGMMGVSIATRSSFMLLPPRFHPPPLIRRALLYAPACALVAIVLTDVAFIGAPGEARTLDLSLDNSRLLVCVGAAALFYFTRNLVLTLALSMLAFTVLRLMA